MFSSSSTGTPDQHGSTTRDTQGVETSWSATGDGNKQESREKLSLALCWAITMHKSQGQTVDKAVIDLGKSEATAGLTFVCLIHAKRLLGLLVEPMPLTDFPSLAKNLL